MFLLEGLPAPKHATIARFGTLHFVHGIGKRKSPLQKSIEQLEAHLDKLKEYTQKLCEFKKQCIKGNNSKIQNGRTGTYLFELKKMHRF